MAVKFNPDMLRLARESRSLSQIELCDKLYVAQGTISKLENGLAPPSSGMLEDISRVLGYPVKFFKQNYNIHPFSLAYYRRRLEMPKLKLASAEARMNITRMLVEKLLDGVDIPDAQTYNWDIGEYGPPEVAAKHIRSLWNVPKGKINNPIKLLEDRGYIIIPFNFDTNKIDGLSMITNNLHPLIFVNREIPLDRQLLTIYHEFGHIVLHLKNKVNLDRDVETEAFDFASEFLVPTNEYKISFTQLDLNTLATLKLYWNISMAALLKKAGRVKLISPNQEKYLWSQLSKLGYRKREPETLDVDIPGPSLLHEIVAVYSKENKYTIALLAQALSVSVEDLKEYLAIKDQEPQPRVVKLRSHQTRHFKDK